MTSIIPAPELPQSVAFNWPVSASQIDTFALCQRKWAWRYIENIKTDPHPSAVLGTAVHKIAEDYQLKGAYPDRLTKEGALFVAGLPFMGPPGTGQVEGSFDMVIEDIRYRGFIDFRGNQLPGHDPARRVVRDYKTSSDPTKYGLWGKENFLKNPQAVLYATYDLIDADDSESHLSWLYFWTKGREKSKESTAILQRSEVEDVFESVIHSNGKSIVRLKIAPPSALDLEPNPEACQAYGGCPYRDRCKLSTRQMVAGALASAKQEEKKMGILNKIKAEKEAGGAANGIALHGGEKDVVNPPERASAKSERPAARADETRRFDAEEIRAATKQIEVAAAKEEKPSKKKPLEAPAVQKTESSDEATEIGKAMMVLMKAGFKSFSK